MNNATCQLVENKYMNLDNFIKDVALALEINASELTQCFELERSQGWDSMGLVSIMSLIDRYFQVYLDYIDVYSCKTFGDLLKLVQK